MNYRKVIYMSQLLLAQTYQIGSSAITNSVIQARNGDYILAGRLFEQNSPNSSAFALRVQPNGMPVWEKTYSSPFTEFFQAITQIADGNFVATGSLFYSGLAGDEYLWVVKLNALGNKIWERAFGSTNAQSDGYDITATADGGFVVTGLFLEKGTNIKFTWVLKFDSNGTLEWDRKYAGGIAFAVTQTKDGGYALSGAHNLPESLNSNVYILRLYPNGDKAWDRVYTDFEVYVLLDSDIIETGTGHFIVVAKSVLLEVDSCGNIIRAHQEGNFSLNSVAQTPDGTYAIGGSLIVNDFDHAYVAVIDQAGDKILWDNTELLYPSGIGQILVDRVGNVVGGGYAPLTDNQSLVFLAIFNPVQALT